ncbi:hypothetical protein GCM10020229_81230 [Kitasatospora albolonga]
MVAVLAAALAAAGITGGVLLLGRSSVWLVGRWAHADQLNEGVMLAAVPLLLVLLLFSASRLPPWRWRLTLGAFLLFAAGWLLFQWTTVQTAQAHVLHERGRAAHGVVVSVQVNRDGDSRAVDVRLDDGTRVDGVRVGFASAAPDPGTEVLLTLDPDGPVPARLGPVPGAPDTTLRNAALAAVALASPVLGLHLAQPLRSRLTRRERVDR